MMEQLDYEGMFASATSPTWLLPPFDQQDATFLSTSRQMLEPIMEETSEDEETQNWSQFESVWSSESDTGSVIRIELHNDQDSISERDFACPAKRPRRDDLLVVEEIPPIRKFNRNENLLLPEIPENITYRKRFDELYSDSDTLSYNSLSRSSSLIQFESLERQLQGDHSSMGSASIRNSSPSLTTFENGESKMSSDGCLRRYESTDGRLHQTYFDLAKIEFNNDLIFRAKSDSESSDNSILSHEERILKPTNLNSASDQRACYKGKNSAENLSEDSGYCEHITALRIKSKSIPNFLRSNDKFCEEDEFENHKSLEMIYKAGSDDNEIGLNSRENAEQENKRELKTKIDAKHEADRRGWYNSEGDILLVDVKNKIHTNNAMAASSSSSRSSSPPSSTSSSPTSFKTSSSLPDVRLQFDHAFDATNNCSRDRDHDQFSRSDCERKTDSAQLRAVSSVPKNLNLTGSNDLPVGNDDDYIWNLRSPKFARSENRSSGGKRYGALRLSPVKPAQNFINVSYNNLTLLDYSGKSNRNSFTMSDHSGNSKRNSREFELGKGNFLLDEISSHFDRNLSILSDREHDSDMISEFLRREVETEENDVDMADVDQTISDEVKPAVTLRKSNSAREQTNSCEIAQVNRKNASLESFDVDPTNVHTNYSESLESCDFDPMGMSNIDLDHSTPVKRGFVASTPNLTTFKSTPDDTEDDDFEFHGSSAHNSLNPIPGEKRLGILLTSGSRNSLGKGVSFCPIVSEISFREQSSEEAADSFDNADAESSIDRIDQPDRPTDQVDHQIIPTTSTSDRVGVQQVRDVNSEIINNPDCTEPDREPVCYERSSSAASNVSTVEQFGVADFSYDIPVTVEMLCSELNNEVVIVPTKNNSNCDDRASDSREKVLHINNNNYNSGNGSGIGNHNSNKNNRKMPNIEANSIKQSSAGTDLLSAKFKPKPDEKHHKNGFLSRFTGGFRFSLRRKKKPAIDKNTNDLIIKQQQQQLAKPSSSKKTPDYVYIPLKGPNPKSMTETPEPRTPSTPSTPPCKTITTERHLPLGGGTNNVDKNHVLLAGKPPLPKQPPRVIGVCEKIRASQQQQQQQSPVNFYNGNGRHAQVIRSKSQPREIDERFLDNERQFYDSNQLIGTMNGNGSSLYLPEDCPVRSQQQYVGGPGSKSTTLPTNSNKIGLIETDLDTHETVISGKTRSLMELGPQIRHPLSGHTDRNSHRPNVSNIIDGATTRRPHKSMEFLLDKENQKNVLPPENELQKSHDSTTALSEHQLRVQASLQRLNIPDWFRQYSSTPKSTETGYKPGNFNRKRASDSGRWTGLNSKTTSLSSLGSQRSDRSPLMLSPSAHSHHGGQTGFSRWSTSHLNSNQTSPSVSTRGSFSRGAVVNSSFVSGHSVGGVSIRNSFRQPYLGWRSQEKLAQPRTPHERLASSLLAQQQAQKKEPPVTPEIQSSIKEVTSAIVHYVNDQTNRTSSRSRSTSPNSRKCWVESSFVGIRPVESPQTPIIENSFSANTTGSVAGTTSSAAPSDILRMNGVVSTDCTSPTAASLEDVLASLLGLPTDSYRSTGDTANEITMNRGITSTSPNSLQVEQQNRFRRRSEGDAQRQKQQQQLQQQQQQQQQQLQQQQQQTSGQKQLPNPSNNSETSITPRRVSLDSSESKTASELLIKCRNTKCDQSAMPIDAKKQYKSCHNCSHQYCSRECRRAHWEKHRKACLHSRVSNLCRQVLSSCKDDTDTLRHLSLLARKGYLSQGRGVVRILFRSPESAEAFIKNGFQCLGEASYVRWPDLMPAEMGLELYSELLRLSTEYKPDSKMLIYVAICVVSEAPGTASAPVRWERQLVSRCAKLKLCKTILTEMDQMQQVVILPETSTEILILTFNPQKKSIPAQRELVLVNIQTILSRRGVTLRKHYPEIFQRLQTYVDGTTDNFMPVTIHPRDSQSGQGFVCIIMPNTGDAELVRLPKSDTGNRVSTFDVGEDLLES